MNICPNCNGQVEENVKFCTACGQEVVSAEATTAEVIVESALENQTYAPPQYQQTYQQPGVEPGKNAAIAALVLGIVAVVFSYVAILGLVAGIIGLIMASNAKKEGFTGGMATAGFICAIVGTILAALGTIACISCSCFACIGASYPLMW